MPVSVSWQGEGRPSIPAARVRAWAERMLVVLRLPRAELSVLLCDDATIHALNYAYRHLNRSTDVLAFAMGEGEGAQYAHGAHGLLGDVVVSLETAARQALPHDRGLDAEVKMLLAHGLLHLLGRDHRTRTQERRMSACVDLLCAASTGSRSALGNSSRRLSGGARPLAALASLRNTFGYSSVSRLAIGHVALRNPSTAIPQRTPRPERK